MQTDQKNSLLSDVDSPTHSKKSENLTYYYSKFDLFDESQYFSFLKYQIFKKKLKKSLGQYWNDYASKAVYFQNNSKALTYLNNDSIFDTAVEVWLELRQNINKNENFEEAGKNEEINQKFQDNQIFELFESKMNEKLSHLQKQANVYKSVLQGFYTTSNQVWQQILSVEHNIFESSQNISLQNLEQDEGNLNMIAQIAREKSEAIIKPLLIAKKKIFSYFQRKNLHNEDIEAKYIFQGQQEGEQLDYDRKSFGYFQENVQKEASEELKLKLSELSLDEYKVDLKNLNRKRKIAEAQQENYNVQIQKISKKYMKLLNPLQICYISKYIEQFMSQSINKYSVARDIVTNTIEINYNLLQEKIALKANEIKDQVQIRFLQPATVFYNTLLKVWLIFKAKNFAIDISFNEYLQQVKSQMGNQWNEKLFSPTKFFFETLINEWNSVKIDSDKEEVLKIFIKRVRETLLIYWEENIVQKLEMINQQQYQE